jgi:hypothetical protein
MKIKNSKQKNVKNKPGEGIESRIIYEKSYLELDEIQRDIYIRGAQAVFRELGFSSIIFFEIVHKIMEERRV